MDSRGFWQGVSGRAPGGGKIGGPDPYAVNSIESRIALGQVFWRTGSRRGFGMGEFELRGA
jgi:hypothetical protein